jgi:hypothetical protein
MTLEEAFDPQISQINADESGRCPAKPYHLAGAPWALATPLFYLRNLRNLRNELRFLA